VTVVAGGMAIIQPFRAKRVVILRDVTFFTGAVAIVGWIVYDHKIYLSEAIGLILYYALYVVTVVGSTWWKNRRRPKVVIQPADETLVDPLIVTESTPLIPKTSINREWWPYSVYHLSILFVT
jgi:Ca2+/Na+ antiporter